MMSTMHWYPETRVRRSRRIVADSVVLVWIAVWCLVGWFVHSAVSSLAAPAGPMRAAGGSLTRMGSAGERVSSVPVVGDEVSAPFVGATAAGTELTAAATRLESSVTMLAWGLSLTIAAVPIAVVLAAYVYMCLRSARTRDELVRYRRSAAGQSLLALRALSSQRLSDLTRVDPDPMGAWRRGEPAVVARLAGLELARAGLRQPDSPALAPAP